MVQTERIATRNLWTNFLDRGLANAGAAFGDISDFLTYTSEDFQPVYEASAAYRKVAMEKNALDFFMHFCYIFEDDSRLVKTLRNEWEENGIPFIIQLALKVLGYEELTLLSPILVKNIWSLTDYATKSKNGSLQFLNKEESKTLTWGDTERFFVSPFMRKITIAETALKYAKGHGVVVFRYGETKPIVECFTIVPHGFCGIRESLSGVVKRKYPDANIGKKSEVQYRTPQIIFKSRLPRQD